MEFDLPKENSSIIKVIGVGGGGSNAVNHMYNQGIIGVDFIVCNTDKQALDISPVPYKIQLGPSLTEGRGAGSIPEIGKNAAVENIDEIRDLLSNNTKMVFVTAGMGGGTGTGAAPVIAGVAKEMGILTVGIVTVPFSFEGRKRRQQAEDGLDAMRRNVDALLIINNERLREVTGNLTIGNAFAQADDVLTVAAKGIAEVISVTGIINTDLNDVNTVMRNSGVAIMGSAKAEGENRSMSAVQQALSSPLLNDNDIKGANYVLLNITYGDAEITMDEMAEITDYIQDEAGSTAEIIFGHGYDASLGNKLSVTVIATGFASTPITGFEKAPEKQRTVLEDEPKAEIKAPLTSPTETNVWNGAKEITNEQAEPFIKKAEAPVVTPPTVNDPVSYYTTNTPPAEPEVKKVNLDDEVTEQGAINFDWDVAAETPAVTESKVEEPVVPTPVAEVKRYTLEDEVEQQVEASSEESKQVLSPEEQQRKQQERMNRIHEFTSRLKKADGIIQFEKEPAYTRRSINLDNNGGYSSDSNASRFSVDKDANGDVKLRGGNSFLHDNVD
ncbi:cell division protein FtsZ [Crocinitomicaceae bacterium CZZ-1]|uniref:Cell division protein FtsZ n=1 Tax=Taishania pollutisoli TaxID=2766479 RepID=A0A8J6P8C4_9FLAO|nr:cell division protein FtsZ [Taishania pollutisoli]MBC9813667.1 cell division protein FtsZ [Taishania pollutisoli]NGF74589.1 cell division protein FtsZ [Fluviicola sp. SGL-29]